MNYVTEWIVSSGGNVNAVDKDDVSDDYSMMLTQLIVFMSLLCEY